MTSYRFQADKEEIWKPRHDRTIEWEKTRGIPPKNTNATK
jgi:hypothetical protein